MAREGTRSATGNSKPRVFQTVDTEPAIKRATKTKKTSSDDGTVAAKVKGLKPTGVTKKKAPAKKEGVGAKVRLTYPLYFPTYPHPRASWRIKSLSGPPGQNSKCFRGRKCAHLV